MTDPAIVWEDRRMRFDYVRVGDLLVDHSYQRMLREEKIKKLVKQWNPLRFSALVICETWNSELFVVDGQNRAEAAKRVKGPDYKVPAMIWIGLTQKEQADAYLGNLLVTKVSALDEHKASLTAEANPTSSAFQEVLDKHGLKIGHGPNNGVGGVRSSYTVIEKYGKTVLDDTFALLEEAFGVHTETWNAFAMKAVALLLHTYPNIDRGRLVEKMTANGIDNTGNHPPVNALAMANRNINYMKAAGARGTNHDILSYFLAQKYNAQLRSSRLDLRLLPRVMPLDS